MYYKLTPAILTSLVNGVSGGTLTDLQLIGGSTGGLKLVRASGFREGVPIEYRPTPEASATDAQLTALITPATGVIAVPALFAPAWLEIPVRWLPAVLGVPAANIPTVGYFQISQESIVDAYGAWIAFLQGLGCSPATPTVNGPIPSLNC